MRGWGEGEEGPPRKNVEECERSRGTTASTSRMSFCSICSKAEKIATYGGNDVFGRIIPVMVQDPEWLRNMRLGSIACMYAWPRMIPRSTSSPNIFLVSTVRQLVCGSSRNLNPMILGTDPSRVPNLRRGLPLALKAAAEKRERTKGQ